MILKLGMKYKGLKMYKVNINGEPGLILTDFMESSVGLICLLKGKICYTK